MVGLVTHQFSATQAEQLSNSAGVATTWVGPNEWNSAHTATVTLTGNTLGVSTVASSNIMLGASGGLSLSGLAGQIFVQGVQLSVWAPNNQGSASATAISALGATTSIFGNMFVLPVEVVAQHFDYYLSNGSFLAGTGYASSSTSHTSTTSGGTTFNAGLWSRQGGTSTGTLTLISSQQVAISASLSQSGSSQSHSDTLSLTWTLGNPTSSQSATFSGTNNVAGGGAALSSGAFLNSWSSNAFVIPNAMTATLEPGEYFFGLAVSTAGSSILTGLNALVVKQGFGNQPIGLLGSVNTTNKAAAALYIQGAIMSGMSANALPTAFTLTNLQNNTFGFAVMEIVGYATGSALYP